MVYQASLAHFWHFFFAPTGQPWYQGNVYGNIVALVPCAFLGGFFGWLWSKTKYWPLNLIHAKLDSLHERHDTHDRRLHELAQSMHALTDSHVQLHEKLDRHLAEPPNVPPRAAELKERQRRLGSP